VSKTKRNRELRRVVDWDQVALEVQNLRLEKIAPEEKLAKAARLAAVYRTAGKPLPDQLAILV